ncbi:hypothetical protein [Actinoplanes auranticolor]|uniref:DUF4760 domain-containing protein n=1 Tax=Actinoplanes auranticolor TaxID=47988 RepID=A0A919VHN2_9ACTN|nr:hypothetical protein [Actinoplanes auranticolor]GIM65929.1 hypothetical protein Aau02nite_20740 [Actinoplanes auranticolor]
MRFTDWIQALSLLVVSIALVLSSLQVRHMARQSRTASSSLRRSSYHALMAGQGELAALFLRDDPVLAQWHIRSRGFKVRDAAEAKRVAFVLLRLNMHEGTLLGHRDGVVSLEHWTAWENVIKLDLADQVYRDCWPVARTLYTRTFVEYVDRVIARLPAPVPVPVGKNPGISAPH